MEVLVVLRAGRPRPTPRCRGVPDRRLTRGRPDAERPRGRVLRGARGGALGDGIGQALHSTDLERARAFYGAVFGWELEPVPDAPFSQWRLAGQVVAVVTATDGVAVPPHWSVNFAVGDADAIAEHAAALGGTVMMAPADTPGFRSAVIADPQGGVIAVSASSGDRLPDWRRG